MTPSHAEPHRPCAECNALIGLPSTQQEPHRFLTLASSENWADVLRRKRERGAVETYVCQNCSCTLVRDTSPKYSAAWIRTTATESAAATP